MKTESYKTDNLPTNGKSKKTNSLYESDSGTYPVKILATIAFAVGVIAISIYAYTKINSLAWLSTSLMIAFACFGLGSVAGLLFSIPKVKQLHGQEQYIEFNTSFEQISDWLTKILIGVGLTQLIQLPSFMQKLSTRIVSSINGNCLPDCLYIDTAFITCLIVFYSIIGFALAYFYGKLDFPKHFGGGLFVSLEKHSITEENLQKETISNKLLKTSAAETFRGDDITDADRNTLKKILSLFEKEIIKQMMEDPYNVYRMPKTKVLKIQEIAELEHLLTLKIVKLVDGDSIYNTSAIELTDKFKTIKMLDIL